MPQLDVPSVRRRARAQGTAIRARALASAAPVALTAALLWSSASPADPFQGLGFVPGGAVSSTANAVSADGSVVVGGSGNQAFRWTAAGGMAAITFGGGPATATGISGDGSVVVGTGSAFGFRWNAGSGSSSSLMGWDFSPFATSTAANAVSADGSAVVGTNFYSSSAFVWIADLRPANSRSIDLYYPSYRRTSSANAISADGSAVVGGAKWRTGVVVGTLFADAILWPGNGGLLSVITRATETYGPVFPIRIPLCIATGVSGDGAVVVGTSTGPSPAGVAFRWTADGGTVFLGTLPGGVGSAATGVSADGTVTVGSSRAASGADEAFRWTAAGGMAGLGHLPGGTSSTARGVSGDGAVIVGADTVGGASTAFLWDAVYGMQPLRDVLITQYGATNLAGWTLASANAVSIDGRTIVGGGTNPAGQTEAWRATGLLVNRAVTGTYSVASGRSEAIGMLGGPGTVSLGAGSSLSIAGNNTSSSPQFPNSIFTGTITGAGDLVKDGSGTWTLAGTFASTGAFRINGGMVVLGGAERILDTAPVTVNAGAALDLAGYAETIGSLSGGGTVALGAGTLTAGGNGDSTVFSGAITGNGALVKTGAGTLTLTGANIYRGGTTIAGGTLRGSTISLQGNITDNAALVFDQAAAGTFAGMITGSGTLTKTGADTLTLTGANSYSGGTLIDAGTLRLSGAGSIGTGPLTVAEGAAFEANNTSPLTSGALSGSGTLTVGAGGLVVGGDNTSTTFSGTLAGSGGLTKTGSSTLILSGINAFTGPTAVNGGTLRVNSPLTGAVSVNDGGRLGGTGSITGTVTVNSGGILAPGNSIGTLAVSGSYSQAAGTVYQVEADSTGQSDRIAVSGVPGTAALNGGTVQVFPAIGSYAAATRYTILSATGGVTGRFGSAVVAGPAYLYPALSYDPNTVFLTLSRYAGFAATANQAAAGAALDVAAQGATGDLATVFTALNSLTQPQLRGAYDQIGGASHAGATQAGLAIRRLFGQAIGDRLARSGSASAVARQAAAGLTGLQFAYGGDTVAEGGPAPAAAAGLTADGTPGGGTAAGPWHAWVQALGQFRRSGSDGNAAGYDQTTGGGIAGLDTQVTPDLLLGGALGYARSDLTLGGGRTPARSTAISLPSMAGTRWGRWCSTACSATPMTAMR